jgi:hypothetical protein
MPCVVLVLFVDVVELFEPVLLFELVFVVIVVFALVLLPGST